MAVGIAVSVFRSEWRRRFGWIVGVALTIALGGGVSIGAFIVAHRTDRAYPGYVDRANVGELTINPSISSRLLDEGIRTLPGVESVHSNSLLFGSLMILTGGRAGDILSAGSTEPPFQIRGSIDGDYVDADRPAVFEGRLPVGEKEVFVGDDARADVSMAIGHQVELGDTVDVAFFWSGLDDQDNPPDPDQIIAPIGVEHLRVVGFGRLPDEVLPDELYARDQLIVSADVAEQYSCTFEIPPDLSADEATLQQITPHDCATSFNYYTLELGDSADITSLRAAYATLADELNALLPPAIRQAHSYEFIAQIRADLDARVRQTTRPTVTALVVFGAVAALATLAVTALLVARNIRRSARDHISLLAIGASTWQRTVVGAAAPLVGAVAGLLGATLVAWSVSPIGPLGVVRDVVPSPGLSMPRSIAAPSLAIGALALLIVIATISVGAARRTSASGRPRAPSLWRVRLLDHGNRPAMSTGVRATLGATGSWGNGAVLVGCVIAIAAVTSATIFGSNLSTLVTQPDRYGWPWDVGVITNVGYGFTDTATVDATLSATDATTHSFYGFDSSIRVDDHPVPALYGLSPDAEFDFPIIDGRAPQASGEAAIGASTAEKFDIHIGDRLMVESSFYEPESVTVVGTVVLPALGSFVADRTALGTGIFILPASPANEFFQYPATFTGISLRSGVSADQFTHELGARIDAFDIGSGQPVQTYTDPVRPPEIVNIGDMRTAPLVLGGLLALSLAAGLALSTTVSVRERRRELAVLRTLGFTGRTLYTSVWWQVISMITIGLIGGLPLGVVAGRYAWSTFADQLGVVPRADVSILLLVAVIGGAVALGIVAALLPARSAARVRPSDILHSSV